MLRLSSGAVLHTECLWPRLWNDQGPYGQGFFLFDFTFYSWQPTKLAFSYTKNISIYRVRNKFQNKERTKRYGKRKKKKKKKKRKKKRRKPTNQPTNQPERGLREHITEHLYLTYWYFAFFLVRQSCLLSLFPRIITMCADPL